MRLWLGCFNFWRRNGNDSGAHLVSVSADDMFGIDPVQLGIIFLANLELGYLTPPVGMNLCLAAYRFKQPMTSIYRATAPCYAILLLGVLLITYVPWITMAPMEWLGR
jgi:TRAP-type C4-dicarboxylate transport system permease large subunit